MYNLYTGTVNVQSALVIFFYKTFFLRSWNNIFSHHKKHGPLRIPVEA